MKTLTESNIVYENGDFWVCNADGQYTVYRSGSTHATADSSYRLNADGLSIAKARCDYLAKRANPSSDTLRQRIISLWHTARTAGNESRYDRMRYVAKHLAPDYPQVTSKALWLAIESAIE